VDGSFGADTEFYEKFKNGIDAVKSERTQTAWNPDEYMGESDEWPEYLKR